MKSESKNILNGLTNMTPKTRSFFLANFICDNGSLDTLQAAKFFSVTSHTIYPSCNWSPNLGRPVALHLRSILKNGMDLIFLVVE